MLVAMPVRTHGEIHRTGRDRLAARRGARRPGRRRVTASLLIGVAAASSDRDALVIAGIAAVVAGAMSMAAGEYNVGVAPSATPSSPTSRARPQELEETPEVELEELTQIYEHRGLDRPLARAGRDPAHEGRRARRPTSATSSASSRPSTARPLQAALVSAAASCSVRSAALLGAVAVPGGARIAVDRGGHARAARASSASPARASAARRRGRPRSGSWWSAGSRWLVAARHRRPASAPSSDRLASRRPRPRRAAPARGRRGRRPPRRRARASRP